MQLLLKAANEGMFTDLTPLMEDTKVYSKYLKEDYLPADTRDNVMFREEWDGASYLMHMAINRNLEMLVEKPLVDHTLKKILLML